MKDVPTKRHWGWIRFNGDTPDGWGMADPDYEALHEAAHTARYGLKNLTQNQAYLLCAAFESYHHLMTHPGGTEYTVGQLRAMRRALNAIEDTTPSPEERARIEQERATK